MSSNRVSYDDCAYELKMNRSVEPGCYRLDKAFPENINQCYSYLGPIGSKADVSTAINAPELAFHDMVDIESQLSFRRHNLSECNNDAKPFVKKNFDKINHKKTCNMNLVAQDTRFSHPIDNYRGMNVISYQYEPYLHVNPQDYIQEIKDRHGIDSRTYCKDNFVPKKYKSWDTYNNGASDYGVTNLSGVGNGFGGNNYKCNVNKK